MIVERQSRFIIAHSSGRRDEALAGEAIAKVHARSGGQPVSWCSDGWRAYPQAIRRLPPTGEDGTAWTAAPGRA